MSWIYETLRDMQKQHSLTAESLFHYMDMLMWYAISMGEKAMDGGGGHDNSGSGSRNKSNGGMMQAFFPDAPMDWVLKFTCEDIPDNLDFYEDGNIVEGATRPLPCMAEEGMCYSGYSNVYINQDFAFCSPEDLYYTMGNELVHVSQINELMGVIYNSTNTCVKEVMDYWAYSWENANGRRLIGYNMPSSGCMMKYSNLNCFYFNWTWNLIHP